MSDWNHKPKRLDRDRRVGRRRMSRVVNTRGALQPRNYSEEESELFITDADLKTVSGGNEANHEKEQ
jgi:hypothetical protein